MFKLISRWFQFDIKLISNWSSSSDYNWLLMRYSFGAGKKMLTKREQCILKDAFCLVLLEEKLFNSAMRILSSIKNVS